MFRSRVASPTHWRWQWWCSKLITEHNSNATEYFTGKFGIIKWKSNNCLEFVSFHFSHMCLSPFISNDNLSKNRLVCYCISYLNSFSFPFWFFYNSRTIIISTETDIEAQIATHFVTLMKIEESFVSEYLQFCGEPEMNPKFCWCKNFPKNEFSSHHSHFFQRVDCTK